MNPFFHRLCAWTAILAFAVGAKLHLPLAQAAGWATMTARYAELMPLDEALATAVSGRELCGVCRYVRDAAAAKQTVESVFQKSFSAPEFPALLPAALNAFAGADTRPTPWPKPENLFAPTAAKIPETPPPRPVV